MWYLLSLSLLLAPLVRAAGKTSIYIDQIPLYSKLPSCAEDRISTIIRGQYSGCGDDNSLTSFSCFCLDSSSEFASIISTAVQEACSVGPATLTVATPAAVVTSALQLFNSYCAKSTELKQASSTSSTQTPIQIATVTITEAATFSPPPPFSPAGDKKTTNIAAIAVPCVIVPLLAIAIASFFFIRRRRSQQNKPAELSANQQYGYGYDTKPPGELVGDSGKVGEMQGSTVAYAQEIGNVERAELDGWSGREGDRKN